MTPRFSFRAFGTLILAFALAACGGNDEAATASGSGGSAGETTDASADAGLHEGATVGGGAGVGNSRTDGSSGSAPDGGAAGGQPTVDGSTGAVDETGSAVDASRPDSATDAANVTDDAGIDASPVVGDDASVDVSADASPDVSDDASLDVGVDASLDVSNDVSVDAPTDVGADEPGQPIACPYVGPDLDDPQQFPSCASSTCSNAHCLPQSLVSPQQQPLLRLCAGGGLCAPDTIIRTANHFVPPTCTSLAGAEGRCISTCLPSVAAMAPILPTAGCGAGTVCAPCYDPTSAEPNIPTGMCSFACDAPTKPPVSLTCPWPWPATKPPVIDPTTLPGCGCGGAHCLPSVEVPASVEQDLNTCSSGFCTPDVVIGTGGNFKPTGCAPYSGVTSTTQGRCLSACFKQVQADPSLEQSICSGTDKCAPCWDPFSGAPTGACSLSSCDAPPPAAYKFPTCCMFQGNAQGRCMPKSQIPDAQEPGLLAQECGDIDTDYLCVPSEQLPSPNNTPGSACHATSLLHLAGYDGTCLSTCLNFPALIGLEFTQGNCPGNKLCVSCSDAPAGTPGC